jgi:two-component system, NarL family, invasion response regulator UvrY
MRVLIADDHPMVRRGLRESLRESFPAATFEEACSGDEALSIVTSRELDIVFMDIEMPGRSGLDALRDIRKIRPDLPVLIMSVHDEIEYGLRALRSGAAGYVSKRATPDILAKAVRQVLEGGKYVTDSLAQRLASDVGAPAAAYEKLSDREMEVLRRLAAGQTVKEIAYDLGLSSKTVHTFRARVLKKLNLRTTADLVRYAIQNGLAAA